MPILPQIEHIVVVMLENRSFDNLAGRLYAPPAAPPRAFLPTGSRATYDGVTDDLWNPSNPSFFNGAPPVRVNIGVPTGFDVPSPNPNEPFASMTHQIFGPNGTTAPADQWMKGFVIDYARAGGAPDEIMACYEASQLPTLSALARNYAISDAWFASVPSQTWANRCFLHGGTSNGHVDNGSVANLGSWDIPTIFTLLEDAGKSWRVYSDMPGGISLVRGMHLSLTAFELSYRFHDFRRFERDCSHDALPQYSFIEPNFFGSDQHPPHDVRRGDEFLRRVWQALSTSPAWRNALLVITYDENGGCFDHVPPPFGATCPDAAGNPGDEGFRFDRFGVRVPTVLVSPYIEAGTVFRSPTATPHDHTSVLATLRDWLGLGQHFLASERIRAAPTLQHVLTLAHPRTDLPQLPAPPLEALISPTFNLPEPAPLNDIQLFLIERAATQLGMSVPSVLRNVHNARDAHDYLMRHHKPLLDYNRE